MTICAPNHTFNNFLLSLDNTFCITNIKRFLALNVIKMQSGVMSFIATINTTMFHFIIPQPLANLFSSIIALFVYSLPIAWLCKPPLSHFFVFCGVICSVAGLAICCLNFVRIPFTPPLNSFSMLLFLGFCFHNNIISLVSCGVKHYPCKPDIFEQTYEKVA